MKEKKASFGGTIRFKEIMSQLITHLTNLTDLVIEMIEQSHKALLEDNEQIYEDLQRKMEKVHFIYNEVEDTVQSGLALHHPFASDLRYSISALKIAYDIHRSAHDAAHIAQSSVYIDLSHYPEIIERVGKLASDAISMFRKSIQSFQKQESVNYDAWKKLDDKIDEEHKKIIFDISEIIQKDPSWSRAGVSLILATRYIERIADHACNIAEETSFIVTSKRKKIE